MKGRFKILVGATVAALLTIGVAVSTRAAELPPTPTGGWQQMWQWCHGGGSASVYLSPAEATQIAKLLGITTQDLYTRRAAGTSISDLGKEKDVSEQQLLEAALAPYKDTLTLRVKYGDLTQAQADQALQSEEANLRTALTSIDTNGSGQRPAGMMGLYGGFGGMTGGVGGMMDGLGGMMRGYGGRGMMGNW